MEEKQKIITSWLKVGNSYHNSIELMLRFFNLLSSFFGNSSGELYVPFLRKLFWFILHVFPNIVSIFEKIMSPSLMSPNNYFSLLKKYFIILNMVHSDTSELDIFDETIIIQDLIQFFKKVLELFECRRGDVCMTYNRNFVYFAHS